MLTPRSKDYLMLLIGDGDELNFSIPRADLRKGTAKFDMIRAPLDAFLRPDDLLDEARLLDHFPESRVAPIVWFFFYASDI
jgi:hypothetical protein